MLLTFGAHCVCIGSPGVFVPLMVAASCCDGAGVSGDGWHCPLYDVHGVAGGVSGTALYKCG